MVKRKTTTTKQKLLRDNPGMQEFIKGCYEEPAEALMVFCDILASVDDNNAFIDEEGRTRDLSEYLPLIKNKEFNEDLKSKAVDKNVIEELKRFTVYLTSQGVLRGKNAK